MTDRHTIANDNTEFDQVDVTLTEDRKSVLLHAYVGERLYMQTVGTSSTELDAETVEDVDRDKWRAKAKPEGWVKL
ncbi:hypothetical protein [Mesorhizobium sp. dw_380]|uniref:hypothetical protein n=1 Tax=Mesorhizobium sp. dw_380 TaxID=2812001 RepID=UPI001BDEC69B|nr:hypothetical protein [Mesorhizobium sp. dw_380]